MLKQNYPIDKIVPPSPAAKSTSIENRYYAYLLNTCKLKEHTCNLYVSGIRYAEQYAAEHGFASCVLFCESAKAAAATARELFADPYFGSKNKLQHRRYSAAINKLLVFLTTEPQGHTD